MDAISRRRFLEASAMGAVALAAVPVFTATPMAENKTMKIFVCPVCGHVEFGEAPERRTEKHR